MVLTEYLKKKVKRRLRKRKSATALVSTKRPRCPAITADRMIQIA